MSLGYVATTNPFGATKWKDEFSPYLKDCDVVIIQDNDDRGREHAAKVAASVSSHAEKIRILTMPDAKDFSEWVEARQREGLATDAIRAAFEKLIDGVAPDQQAEINRLAKLPLLEYEQQRLAAASHLGIRVSSLDTLVERAHPPSSENTQGQGTPLTFPDIELWPDPVDGETLVGELEEPSYHPR